MNPILAESLGYPVYREFDIKDESTYTRLVEDAIAYFKEFPASDRYYCWVPGYELISVHREAIGSLAA